MERRDFLRASALAVAGLTIEACSSRRTTGHKIDVFPGGEELVAGVDTYFAFGTSEGRATMVAFEEGARGGGTKIGPLRPEFVSYRHPEAPPSPQGVNAIDVRFPKAGLWRVQASGAGGSGSAVVEVRDRSDARVPLPGAKAVDVATPTARDHRGVDPICTRAQPCPFHRVSLDAALRAREPIAFFVGSPKFCSSRTCGPNLEELIDVAATTGARATFIHSEVYVDSDADSIRKGRFTPTFRRWRLPSEPWLFLIGRDGRIAARFEGPVTAGQIEKSLVSVL